MPDAVEARAFYVEQVWPRLDDELRARVRQRWPRLRLEPAPGYRPLAELPLRLLCGLTGSGKSTTLAALRREGRRQFREDLPSRRDLADLILIPTAQLHGGQAIHPVHDRSERFRWTQRFAQEISSGGSASAFTWLYYRPDGNAALLGEGLRGAREISAALRDCPRWRIAELWLEPLLRLRRLGGRDEAFDALVSGAADLSWLPAAQQARARELLAAGEISARALVIATAEARNYGALPFAGDHLNYRCLRMDELTPQQAARAAGDFLFAPETA